MKAIEQILKSPLITTVTGTGEDGAMFEFKYKARKYEVIASNGWRMGSCFHYSA